MMHWIFIYVFISLLALIVCHHFSRRRLGDLRLANFHRHYLRNTLAQEYTAMSVLLKKLGAPEFRDHNRLLDNAFLYANLPGKESLALVSFYDSMQPWLTHQESTHDLQYDLWIDPSLYKRTIGIDTAFCIQKTIYELVPLLSTGHPISIYFKNIEGKAQLHLLHPELTLDQANEKKWMQNIIYRITISGLVLDDENQDGWIISGL